MAGPDAAAPEAPPPLLSADGWTPPEGGRAVWLSASDGVRLRAAHWPAPTDAPPRGGALLFQGRTEFIEKLYEPIARLRALGLSVTTLDWRGQGLSTRQLADQRRGHVRAFAEYQRDVDAALAFFRERAAPGPKVLIAHSMGGAIAARALMRQAAGALGEPGFVAAVFSAPMLGLAGTAGRRPARVAAAAVAGLGWARSYAPGGSATPFVAAGFEGNPLTSDPDRFERAIAGMVRAHPELALGGATWGWLRAATWEMPRLRPTPIPLMIAVGDAETVVSPEAAEAFAAKAPKGSFLRLTGGARHEPFLESDAVQAQLWEAIGAFLDLWAPTSGAAPSPPEAGGGA